MMTATLLPQEVEAKFRLTDLAAAEAFLTDPRFTESFTAGPAWVASTTDVYLDTPDFRCLRFGYGLRVRTLGERRLAALKSLALNATPTDGIVQRTEVEIELPADAELSTPSTWPEAVAAMLAGIAGAKATLQPLCVIRQERRKCLVYAKITDAQTDLAPAAALEQDLQQAIAEFSLDHVMVAESTTATRDPFAESAAAIQWCELEIEAAPGGEAQAFTALVRTVKAALAVRPSPGSKLEQALQQLHEAEANGRIQPHTAMTEACRALWREQLLRMLAVEAGVRLSAPTRNTCTRCGCHPACPGSRGAHGPFFRPRAIRRYLQRAAPDCTAAGRRAGSGRGD